MWSESVDQTSIWKPVLALFCGGFTVYSLLYCTQPLLPVLSDYFHVSPTMASLSLSGATVGLIAGMQVAPHISGRWGRKKIMAGALVLAALLVRGVLPSWYWLVLPP